MLFFGGIFIVWRERILEDFFKNPVLPMVSIKVIYDDHVSPICLSWVWLQTELDEMKPYYELIMEITISEKRRIAKLWKKGNICIKRLTKET